MTNDAYATERDLTRRLNSLETEKIGLIYAWFDANKGAPRDWKVAEKATAGRKREILDEQKVLRAKRAALKAAARTEREQRAATNREKRQAARESVTAECQICEGRQCMTRDGSMVHHGYQRPGSGYIIGDCFGVGRKPYPSTDALAEYLVSVTEGEKGVADALAGLAAQTVIVEVSQNFSYPSKTYRKEECDAHTWERKLQSLRWKLESDSRWLKSEIKRVKARIAAAGGIEAAQ